MLNFGTETSTKNYRQYVGKFPPPGKFIPERASVVLNTQNFNHDNYEPGKMIGLNKVTLEPGQGLVVKFMAGY